MAGFGIPEIFVILTLLLIPALFILLVFILIKLNKTRVMKRYVYIFVVWFILILISLSYYLSNLRVEIRLQEKIEKYETKNYKIGDTISKEEFYEYEKNQRVLASLIKEYNQLNKKNSNIILAFYFLLINFLLMGYIFFKKIKSDSIR